MKKRKFVVVETERAAVVAAAIEHAEREVELIVAFA